METIYRDALSETFAHLNYLQEDYYQKTQFKHSYEVAYDLEAFGT